MLFGHNGSKEKQTVSQLSPNPPLSDNLHEAAAQNDFYGINVSNKKP